MELLLDNIRNIIAQARERVARSVNHELTVAYWHIGQLLVEEEQKGKERAEYGKRLVEELSLHLTAEFGAGFSAKNLWFMRQFYQTFPILSAVSRELTWTHYKTLVRIESPDKQTFYIAEAVKNTWSVRQMERQINSLLYERLLMSQDKESVLAIAKGERHPTQPLEIISSYAKKCKKNWNGFRTLITNNG